MSTTNDGWHFTNATAVNAAEHDVVLQSLNQWRHIEGPAGKKRLVYYGEDNFAGTEPKWDTVPVIFTKKGHPKTRFQLDPETALEECEGQVVGGFHESRIDKTGTAKFRGKLEFDDPEVEALHKAGKLVISSGFYSKFDPQGRLTGQVDPDHIIVFEPRPDLRPQDSAAMFLNASPSKKAEFIEKIGHLFDSIKKTLVANAVSTLLKDESADFLRYKLLDAIKAVDGITETGPEWAMIEDVFPESVVYRLSGNSNEVLYRRDYTDGPGGISLGDRSEVRIAYIPVDVSAAASSAPAPVPAGLDLNPGAQRWTLTGNATEQNEPVMNAGDTARTGSGSESMTEATNPGEITALNAAIGERDKKIENLSAQNAAYETEIKQLKDAQEKARLADLDAKWQTVKANVLLPSATHKAEDEAALKAQFIESPHEFITNAIATQKRAPEVKPEGQEFVGNSTTPESDKECAEICAEMRKIRGRR